MKLPICGSFGNRLNGSDIETREFILKSKSMGKNPKANTLIPNFTILQKTHTIVNNGRFPFMAIQLLLKEIKCSTLL